MKNRQQAFYYLLSLGLILAVWKIVALILHSPVLPQPEAAFLATGRAIMTSDFWMHFADSTYRVVISIVISLAIAFPLGIALGYNTKLDRIIAPVLFLTYPIPKIVFLPVVLVLFGLGDVSKIVLITLIITYQLLIIIRDGVSNINKKHVETIRSMGGGNSQVVFQVLIPAAFPAMFTALRLSAGTAITVLFIVETYATRTGLGYYIMNAWSKAAYDVMFAGIIGMSVLGIILYAIFSSMEKVICRWKMLERIKTDITEVRPNFR